MDSGELATDLGPPIVPSILEWSEQNILNRTAPFLFAISTSIISLKLGTKAVSPVCYIVLTFC